MSEPPTAVKRFQGVALDALHNNDGSELHPAVRELAGKALQGRVDRRSVLRVLAWLGVSVGSARGILAVAAGAGAGGAAGAGAVGPAAGPTAGAGAGSAKQ